MLVAFCIFKYFPHGGIPRDLMKLARECRRRGHAVRVYAGRWLGERPRDVEVVEVRVPGLANHARYRRFAARVHEHLRTAPADLVVGMNKMPGLDVYYAGDSCFEEKARSQRSALYRLTPRYRLFARFEQAVFDARVDTDILTISDAEVPHFRKHYGTPAERFHRLPPGIDRDRAAGADSPAQRAAFRREFGLADDDLLLLFLGSGFIKKGLDRALRALHALPPELARRTRLFVVGHDNAAPFRRLARRLGVQQRVTFFEGRDDVPRFLFGADALVLPAYDENAGMVIIEAMIAGLPALVTGNCGYAGYLRDADAGLVAPVPFDQTAFDRQLAELLTSPQRDRWRANGRALGRDPDIYRLAEIAVDHLEAAARRRRPVVALVWPAPPADDTVAHPGVQVARDCVARGMAVRVYAPAWTGPVPQGLEAVPMPAGMRSSGLGACRVARWVRDDLGWRPAACVVGFAPLPGLNFDVVVDPHEAPGRAADQIEEHVRGTRLPA